MEHTQCPLCHGEGALIDDDTDQTYLCHRCWGEGQ